MRKFLLGLGFGLSLLALLGATTISGPITFSSTFSTAKGIVDIAPAAVTPAQAAAATAFMLGSAK